MIQLLVDANLDGHAELLEKRLNSAIWLELQKHLDIHSLTWNKLVSIEPPRMTSCGGIASNMAITC